MIFASPRDRNRNHVNLTENVPQTMNSARANLDTNIPQHDLRFINRLSMNTENVDADLNDPLNENNENSQFDQIPTERGNNEFLMSNNFMNNSGTNLLSFSNLERKNLPQIPPIPQTIHSKRSISDQDTIKSKTSICKICLSEEEDPINDPLITPCKCDGTMRYLHINCLKEWIKSKCRSAESENCKTYVWENLF